jgi:hypothetical protein
MVCPHRTASKSIGCQPAGQMAPNDVPPQPKPQPVSPQYVPQDEDPFEIVVMVPVREEVLEAMEEAQQLPQNNGNNDNHDNDNDHEEEEENNEAEEEDNEAKEEEGNKDKDKDDEYYTLLSDFEKEKMYCDANEIKTSRNEAPIPTSILRDLLTCIGIATPPKFRIKRVLHPRREEYKKIVEIFNGPSVVSQHKGPAFRATYKDVVSDAAW